MFTYGYKDTAPISIYLTFFVGIRTLIKFKSCIRHYFGSGLS